MGMYTEFHFNAELPNTLEFATAKPILDFMLNKRGANVAYTGRLPNHPLFSTARWRTMLQMDSYYFSAESHSTLRYDDIDKNWYLCIRCNLKNYDQEIEKFCDWIRPYINPTETFLGFLRYEECEAPDLIYLDGIYKVTAPTAMPISQRLEQEANQAKEN